MAESHKRNLFYFRISEIKGISEKAVVKASFVSRGAGTGDHQGQGLLSWKLCHFVKAEKRDSVARASIVKGTGTVIKAKRRVLGLKAIS